MLAAADGNPIRFCSDDRVDCLTSNKLEIEEKMKKLRWVMDGGFWDLDMSTPMTVDGIARAVPGDTLPLGVSRGTKLSRPRQIDFLQRFMLLPFVPSYAGGDGFALQRVLTFPFGGENWFGTVLGQFNVQKLVSSMKASASKQPQESSLLNKFRRHICDKSLYGLGLCGEFFIGHDDTLLVSSELYGEDKKSIRNKAVFNHKFPQHNLTVEAVWPGLFVDQDGSFWDVPLSMGIDLASVASDSGSSYHLSFNHNSGAPKMFGGDLSEQIPQTLLPGFCVKSAMSVKRNIDIWRSKAGKLRMVQPFDVFLSDPHVSASGCIGTVVTAALGENSVRSQGEKDSKDFGSFSLRGLDNKSVLLADLFASVSCTAQYGNFQRLFFDLTRIHTRLDFPSGSKFIIGAAHAAHDIYNSKRPDLDALQAICPDITVSLQQQIFGEFSFRVDSRVALDFKSRDRFAHVNDIVFAVEYALKVLGSAKAVAWYSPKNQEAMVELRFFET